MKRKRIFRFIAVCLIFGILASLISFCFKMSTSKYQQTFFEETAVSSIDYSFEIPQVYAESAIVIDAYGKNVLFSKNADESRGMASTTKIMTALVAIEHGELDKDFPIPKEATGIEGSSVYLLESEPLSLRELLYCLLLESGNDAAVAIAIIVGGNEENFVKMMNARAKEMGLEHTHFANPHGLSHPEHRTTARELAMITAEAMQYPLFEEITSTKSIKVRYDGKADGRFLSNHNKMLNSYDGCLGTKTGYTLLDGKCLVSSAERNGLKVIAVTLKDSSPMSSHTTLLDLAFEKFQAVKIADIGKISTDIAIENGEKEFLKICNMQKAVICLPKGAKYEIELDVPNAILAPVEEYRTIGRAKVICQGKEVYIINLESIENIKEKEKSFFEKLFGK